MMGTGNQGQERATNLVDRSKRKASTQQRMVPAKPESAEQKHGKKLELECPLKAEKIQTVNHELAIKQTGIVSHPDLFSSKF